MVFHYRRPMNLSVLFAFSLFSCVFTHPVEASVSTESSPKFSQSQAHKKRQSLRLKKRIDVKNALPARNIQRVLTRQVKSSTASPRISTLRRVRILRQKVNSSTASSRISTLRRVRVARPKVNSSAASSRISTLRRVRVARRRVKSPAEVALATTTQNPTVNVTPRGFVTAEASIIPTPQVVGTPPPPPVLAVPPVPPIARGVALADQLQTVRLTEVAARISAPRTPQPSMDAVLAGIRTGVSLKRVNVTRTNVAAAANAASVLQIRTAAARLNPVTTTVKDNAVVGTVTDTTVPLAGHRQHTHTPNAYAGVVALTQPRISAADKKREKDEKKEKVTAAHKKFKERMTAQRQVGNGDQRTFQARIEQTQQGLKKVTHQQTPDLPQHEFVKMRGRLKPTPKPVERYGDDFGTVVD